jgi:hypothetical protein
MRPSSTFRASRSQFDRWFDAARDGVDTPDVRLQIPEEIRAILTEFRAGGSNKEAAWIPFAILSLSRVQLATLAALFREASAQRPLRGQYRRVVHSISDLAVLFVVAIDGPLDNLQNRVMARAVLEKYVRRTSRCIAFGPSRPTGSGLSYSVVVRGPLGT